MEDTKNSSDIKRDKSLTPLSKEFADDTNRDQIPEINPLTEEEWDAINQKIMNNMPYIEKSLQEIPVNVKGVYLSVFVSFLFIVLASYINRVEDVSRIASVIRDKFENSYWDENSGNLFADIGVLNDMSTYIRRVAIPATDSSLGNYNYFIGLRMTLKNSEIIENENPKTNAKIKYIKKTPNITPKGSNGFKDKNFANLWTYKQGFADNYGYVIYYLPSITNITLLEIWREAEKMWIDTSDFGSLTIEYLFHNSNSDCTLYYFQTFELSPSGTVYPRSEVLGSFIEKFEKIEKDSLIIFILFVIYSLGFSLQIFKLAQNLLRTCKTLFVKRKLDLVWHEYIEICSVVLALVSLILFGTSVFGLIGKYKLPAKSESDFNGIVNYCWGFRLLIQFTALAALLISFKVIVVLRYKFPSFGVLFDTILEAKTDIINFIMITIFLLVGFVFWGNLAFGKGVKPFSTSVFTFQKLFDMSLGQLDVKDDIKAENDIMSTIFLLVFLTVFFLVLTNMFLAIVMSTYGDLKIKGQLILEAKAEMIAEQSEEWFQALLNLLLFRVVSVENDAIKYEEQQEINREGMTEQQKQDIDEKIKMYETLIIASTKVDIVKIFKTNFGKMSSLSKPTLLTHEQNMQKIQMTLEKILERSELKKKRIALFQKLVDHNFNLVLQMFIYIIFIIIFIIMILLRLRVTDSYGVYQLNSESFVSTTFGNDLTLADTTTQERVFQYLYEVFVPKVSGESLYNHNYFLDDERARITLQFYDPSSNKNSFSDEVIKKVVKKNEFNIKKESFRGENSKLLYEYFPSGTKESFRQDGGFIFYLSVNENMNDVLKLIEFDDVLGSKGYYMAIEWVTYNANLNLFAYSYILFTHEISGQISNEFYCKPIELDYFKDKIPVRGILEIIYFLFTLYYSVIEAKEWLGVWRIVREKVRTKQKGSDTLYRVVIKLLGSNKEEKGCANMVRITLIRIKSGFGWCFTIFLNFIQTMKMYFQKDSFNVIDVISIILSIMNLSQILQLALNDFMKNFSIEESSKYDYIGELYEINSILISYRQIVAFNCLIVFIRLLQFYKFSKRLSLLTDILDSATLDLIFYMLMFSIVLFAYMLMGYLLLGHTLSSFKTLQEALISCYLMLIGQYVSTEIYEADEIFGTLFLISFIVVFSLILLNMFIAIIGSHFEIVAEGVDQEEEDMGFFAKIVSVIVAKRKGKKYLDDPETIDPNDDDQNEKDGDHLKNIEEDLYRIEEPMPDPCSSAYWMKVAETMLNEKSDKKISLFGLKMMSSSKEKNQKITAIADLTEIALVSLEQWKEANFAEKLKIWRTLALISREYAIRSIEKAYIEGDEVPERVRLFKTMEKIWNSNTQDEKLQLWMGPEHFDHIERVSVWNFLNFKNETFNFDLEKDFEEIWTEYSIEEKLERVSSIVEAYQKDIRRMRKNKSRLDGIMNIANKIDDFKFVLWIGLTKNSHWLKCLFMNEPNDLQANIIAFLNLSLYQSNIFALEGMDGGLEDLLDGMIYDFVESKATFMSEMQKLVNTRTQVLSSKKDVESLQDYKEYARLEVEKQKKKKNELEAEYRRYKRK